MRNCIAKRALSAIATGSTGKRNAGSLARCRSTRAISEHIFRSRIFTTMSAGRNSPSNTEMPHVDARQRALSAWRISRENDQGKRGRNQSAKVEVKSSFKLPAFYMGGFGGGGGVFGCLPVVLYTFICG